MSTRKAFRIWSALIAVTIVLGAGLAFASHRRGCWKYADSLINWYNGGTGDYKNIYEEEAKTDADSWHNFTDVNFNSVAAAGTTDHLNAYNGFYGNTGWLGLGEIRAYSGCIIKNGRIRLNQTYLDNGSYTRTNKESIACHEIGHLLGLDHSPNATSCMSHTLTAAQPDTHDRDVVNSIY
ncbi:MAG TPA: matrixin family metalloprotease [Thermoanaerobaculia bacterium]